MNRDYENVISDYTESILYENIIIMKYSGSKPGINL